VVPQAAALSSLVTKSLLHPIDTLKCRAQACPASAYYGKGFFQYYRGQWSLGHLYGGLPIKLAVYIPYQSIYMTSYDLSRSRFASMWGAGEGMEPTWASRTAVALSAAVVAEGATAVVRVPMEAIKIRIQSTASANTQTAITQLWQHGFRKVSRLFVPQTLCSDLPYSCIQWITYENVRPRLKAYVDSVFCEEDGKVPREQTRFYNAARLGSSFAIGGCSGLLASTLTIPLDVIKTRVVIMASSEQFGGRVPGFVDTGRSMVRSEGVRALFRGGHWRVLWIASNTAVYFCIFERLKEIL
jgi:solute carrier family 25 S-adenosylmethionine transporter 26